MIEIPASVFIGALFILGMGTLIGARTLSRLEPDEVQIVRWKIRVVTGLAYIVGVVVLTVMVACVYITMTVKPLSETVKTVQTNVNTIKNGKSPAAIEAKQVRAENRYIQCFTARDDIALAEKTGGAAVAADMKRACKSYLTLAAAYKAEGVPPRKGK